MLLDTHVVLWWAAGSPLLSKRAESAIRSASRLFVSPLSCWEVARLAHRGRIELANAPAAWTRAMFDQDRVEPALTTPEAAIAAAALPDSFPGDPIDRLLYATAADLRLPMITRDRAMHRFAAQRRDTRTIW